MGVSLVLVGFVVLALVVGLLNGLRNPGNNPVEENPLGANLVATPTYTSTHSPSPTPTPSSIPTLHPTFTPTQVPSLAPTPLNMPTPLRIQVVGATWERVTDGMVMVYVPGGTFMMGSDPTMDKDARSDERPQHPVTLSSFWLDQTEVTNAMYSTCVTTGQCEESSHANDPDFNGDNYPVVGVSWHDAQAYCQWVGGQLPTEAQWEYAARGTDGRLYPWGDEMPTCDRTWFTECDDSNSPVAVGNFPMGNSWVGAADMAGNVWEWVADWYDSEYYGNSPTENPSGPASGRLKVLRGGSWFNFPLYLRVAYRSFDIPDYHFGHLGFRCVVSPGN